MGNDEKRLQDAVARFVGDPLGFVRFAFPWGEAGTPLANIKGPDKWQTEFLTRLGQSVRASSDPIKMAATTGHGTGKSALSSWVLIWFMSTRPECRIVCTANTRDQLTKKLWSELAVWHKRSINRHWHEWTATKFYNVNAPENWFASAIPWSRENSEAFAGTHARHVLLVFDEASAIDDVIWEVAEGAMTTDGSLWLAFGNPTRNTGRFRECFGAHAHRWTTYKVDSRDAMMTNKTLLKQWVEDYGEDSDFVRVRVKGEFPRAGTAQFIPSDLVDRAMRTTTVEDPEAVRVLGVDVARFGDDQTILLKRWGTRVLPLEKHRGLDTMQVAARVATVIDDWNPDAVFVDGTGLGAGVVDRLRQLNYRVIDVVSSSEASDKTVYANKRAEMWGLTREWLRGEVALPDDDGLRKGLIAVEYGHNARNAIQLEKKADLKGRGLDSPDEADALALTFAEPVRAHRAIYLPSEVSFRRRRGELDWRVL